MSIKFRLLLSYVAMTIIPIILIVLVSFTFNYVIFNDSHGNRIFPPNKIIERSFLESYKVNREINSILIDNESDLLLDIDEIKELDKELIDNYSGLVMRKNEEIIYISDDLKKIVDTNTLPSFKEEFKHDNNVKPEDGYIINFQNDFYLEDGSEASLFIITNMDLIKTEFNKIRNIFTTITIVILILTTITITIVIYKDIRKSIQKLEKATEEIKNGNLDYEVKKHISDEIGDLSEAFDEMRLKLKNSLEMQKKYEENRKVLISSISHDLKTPIMSIKGYIEGIKDGIADTPEKMDKYINTIYKKAEDMEILINELFMFSRLDLEKEEFNYQIIDLIEFLKFSVDDLSFNLEKIGGNISLNYNYEPIYIKADLQKLKRVVLNIVENSIKYRKDEKLEVEINVTKFEDKVKVQFKDNGKGINERHLPFIFDRFYRADKSRNTNIVGSGLGLAISKQIIEKHGGKMWVESVEKEGTNIYFTLDSVKKER